MNLVCVHISCLPNGFYYYMQVQKNAQLKSHPDCESIKLSVSNVLAACQQYMRKREVTLL